MKCKNDHLNLHGIPINRESLTQHMLITGTTGSGKTHGIIKPMLRQLLAQGDAAIIFDVKGDLLPIVREALDRCGRLSDLVTLGVGPYDATFNPLEDDSLTASQIAKMLLSAASFADQNQRTSTEEMYWQQARAELLCSMVELARIVNQAQGSADNLTFAHLNSLRRLLSQPSSKLVKWANEIAASLSDAGGNGLVEFASLPDSTRSCVLTSVSNLIAPFIREPLSLFVNPVKNRPQLHLTDILDNSKVVVVTAANMEHQLDLWPAFMLFKMALYRLVLCRPRLKVRQDNHLVICLDEYTRMLMKHDAMASEHVVLEAARSSRTSFILAAQNLSGLNASGTNVITDKLAALCGTLCFLANNCPATATLAQRCLGTKQTFQRHRTLSTAGMPPPLLFPDDHFEADEADAVTTLIPTEEPVVSSSELARLKTGVAHIKLVDGTNHRIECDFN